MDYTKHPKTFTPQLQDILSLTTFLESVLKAPKRKTRSYLIKRAASFLAHAPNREYTAETVAGLLSPDYSSSFRPFTLEDIKLTVQEIDSHNGLRKAWLQSKRMATCPRQKK